MSGAAVTLAVIVVGTYLLRVSMFLVVRPGGLPHWLHTPFSLVGPAALAALVASMLLTVDGRAGVAPLPQVVAVVVGFVVVLRTGDVMHALLVGLPTLWVLTWLVG